MTRRYSTPAAFKAAIEQRLRTKAQETATSLVRLRQLLVFDRFLARVFDVLGDALILKGGLAVELRISRARTTKDIDLRMTGSPARVLDHLQRAGRIDLGDHLTYEVAEDPKHPEITAEAMVYSGRRFRSEARLAGRIYGQCFGVDVGFADPITQRPELVQGSNFLDFAGIKHPESWAWEDDDMAGES